ncbi:hypothetical protein WJX84_005892 [Apatococcus fuscideae]|uniref:Uncharacterized protein n=1 Tax=Apatococcus fuscideae TaxID=2026836 RepID=A0AAW1TGY6_9CHLO
MPALGKEFNKDLSLEAYAELKERVQQLKSSQAQSKQLQQGFQKLEVLAAEKAEGQQREQLLQSRIQALNDSLKQSYDRASRARVHHDRDKKALARKVEDLAQQLKAAEAGQEAAARTLQDQHQADMAGLADAHDQELAVMQDKLKQAATSQADKQQAVEAQMAAVEQRAAEWCRQELTTAAADFRLQLEASQADAAAQQDRALRAETSLDNAQALIDSLQAQLQQAECRATSAEEAQVRSNQELKQSQQEIEKLQNRADMGSKQAHTDLLTIQHQHTRQVEDLKTSHQDDMYVLHGRVASIVKRKDEQAGILTQQLVQLQQKLVGYDEMFARERHNLINICDDSA